MVLEHKGAERKQYQISLRYADIFNVSYCRLQVIEPTFKSLLQGRSELQSYLERRQALDRACHAVLAAQERDKGQELTDEFVDARIKAVWQVVAGVAESIRLLYPRYAPGSNSKETLRHNRCTGMIFDFAFISNNNSFRTENYDFKN